MLNVVILTGRLTANPELKTTTNLLSVCSFTVAVDRKYTPGNEKTADFINVVAWRKTAEFVSKYFTKGSMIAIEGSIQTRKYKDKDGNTRTAFEVVANNVQFADFGKKENSNQNIDVDPNNDQLKQFAESMDLEEITEDNDLPF